MVHGNGKIGREREDAKAWETVLYSDEIAAKETPFDQLVGQSFSGHERNRFFLSKQADEFLDLSGVSGLDSVSDGRVLALWDYQRDGWQDLVVANANAPLLSIYRNELGDRAEGQFIAVRFEGGNRSAQASTMACRDGYGAKVEVKAGERVYLRESRCGEGMAGQNSRTLLIGIGQASSAESVTVTWPSGRQQSRPDVQAGSLLTFYEDASHSPAGDGVHRQDYQSERPLASPSPEREPKGLRLEGLVAAETPAPRLRLYTTMATWCPSCLKHLPQLKHLSEASEEGELVLYGLPVDEADTPAKLKKYVARHAPAYRLVEGFDSKERARVKKLLSDSLKSEVLPSSIVTDGDGRVLLVTEGLPTLSQLRQLSP